MQTKKTIETKKSIRRIKSKSENNIVRNKRPFKIYIYKVLKQVHPDLSITRKAMDIMNSLINDTFDKITFEICQLIRFNNKKARTLRSREIQTAVKLLFPGGLSIHAIKEGVKAQTNYTFYFMKQHEESSISNCLVQEE